MVGGVLIPVALVIVYDAVVFFLVMRRLSKKVEGKQSAKSDREELLRRFQNALAFIVLLGLTWMVGFLTVIQTPNDDNVEITFDVIFIVLNSLQGVFIFIFYCMRNPRVRTTWKQIFRRYVPAWATILTISTTKTSKSQSNTNASNNDQEKFRKVKASMIYDHGPELDDDNTKSLTGPSSRLPSDHDNPNIEHAYDNNIVLDDDIDDIGIDVISCNVEDATETVSSEAT